MKIYYIFIISKKLFYKIKKYFLIYNCINAVATKVFDKEATPTKKKVT